MIKLFVLDIDGCVTMPFEIPDWDALAEIRRLNDRSRTDPSVPPVTICSGRPQPYVEAVGQWLGAYKPLVFESGGGMFDPVKVKLHWPDHLDSRRESEIAEIRTWVDAHIISNYDGSAIEFTKRTDVGIIHTDEAIIIEMYEQVKEYILKSHPDFEVHRTEISINVIMSRSNKGSGLRWLSEKCKIPMEQMAYIGDSSGDIPALELAGMKFTPANGIDRMDEMPGLTRTEGEATWGVV
ncbi:MAG: HAD-IIB family hydrolase, partial [Balneolia bacterium]|nr:HAD-IIB family hydrolase [Balneolia bacterium]